MTMNAVMQHRAEFARALRNFRYERTPTGILFPEQRMHVGGVFTHRVNGQDAAVDPNVFTYEGLDDLLNVYFHGSTQPTTFYIAPFSGDVSPAQSLTAATFTATQTEFTNYTESTRVVWNEAAAASQSITNAANPARFTIGTGGGTIWGAALATASTKSATTGKLPACAKFSDSRVLLAGDKLDIEYALTAADDGV